MRVWRWETIDYEPGFPLSIDNVCMGFGKAPFTVEIEVHGYEPQGVWIAGSDTHFEEVGPNVWRAQVSRMLETVTLLAPKTGTPYPRQVRMRVYEIQAASELQWPPPPSKIPAARAALRTALVDGDDPDKFLDALQDYIDVQIAEKTQ